MFACVKDLFDQWFPLGGNEADGNPAQAVQIATAVLLIEMMRVDFDVKDVERTSVTETLRRQFDMNPVQLDQVIALAEAAANDANGYHQFTSLINTHFDLAKKIDIIESLWRIAMVDLHLSEHELHLMRKMGDLLHIGHADFVAAKQRAREVAGLLPG